MKKLIVLLPLIFFFTVNAQVTSPNKEYNWSACIFGGSSFYTGDVEINEIFAFTNTNRELQLVSAFTLSNRISPAISLDLKVVRGNISGSKWENNSYFKSRIFEADLRIKYLFLSTCFPANNSGFTPYLGTGLGTIAWNTDLYNFRKEDKSPQENAPAIKGNKLTIPLALGCDYRINKRFSANGEVDFHLASTNKMDGIENGESMDKYAYLTAGMIYHFGNPIKAASMKFARKNEKSALLVNESGKKHNFCREHCGENRNNQFSCWHR